jgi:hypothetical protein
MLNLERNFHAALDFVRDLVEHDADLAAAVDAAADRFGLAPRALYAYFAMGYKLEDQ